MIIDFGRGQYVDSTGPRTEHHRRITEARPLYNTAAYRVVLECGHHANAFTAMRRPVGYVVLCAECRDMSKGRE